MRRTVGFVTGATGLGLLAVGGAAAIAATLEWSAARHDCGSGYPATCADLGDASSARSATIAAGTVADLALVIGGAAVVTGAALVLLTPPPGQPGAPVGRLTLAPSLGPATTGVVLHGTF